MKREHEDKSRLLKRFFHELHHTTKFTWVTLLLCTGCIITIAMTDIPDIAKVSLNVLIISFSIFSFHTGYRKENICFYIICLSVSIPLTVIAIYSIATYIPEVRAPFGYVIVEMNVVVFLAAQILRQIGLIIRKVHLKDSSIKLEKSVIYITICAALLPVVLVFTVIEALGENFGSVPRPKSFGNIIPFKLFLKILPFP